MSKLRRLNVCLTPLVRRSYCNSQKRENKSLVSCSVTSMMEEALYSTLPVTLLLSFSYREAFVSLSLTAEQRFKSYFVE